MGNVNVNQQFTTTNATPACRCCDGSGVQTLLTGERIICKACSGSGQYAAPALPTWPWWEYQQPVWDIVYTTNSPSYQRGAGYTSPPCW